MRISKKERRNKKMENGWKINNRLTLNLHFLYPASRRRRILTNAGTELNFYDNFHPYFMDFFFLLPQFSNLVFLIAKKKILTFLCSGAKTSHIDATIFDTSPNDAFGFCPFIAACVSRKNNAYADTGLQ